MPSVLQLRGCNPAIERKAYCVYQLAELRSSVEAHRKNSCPAPAKWASLGVRSPCQRGTLKPDAAVFLNDPEELQPAWPLPCTASVLIRSGLEFRAGGRQGTEIGGRQLQNQGSLHPARIPWGVPRLRRRRHLLCRGRVGPRRRDQCHGHHHSHSPKNDPLGQSAFKMVSAFGTSYRPGARHLGSLQNLSQIVL